MENCININHPDIIRLASELNLPTIVVAAKVSIWQEDNNNYEEFPNKDELLKVSEYSIDAKDDMEEEQLKGLQDMSSLGALEGEFVTVEDGAMGFSKQQMLRLLGSSMYSKPIAQVALKELLQNSFDAVKMEQNKHKKYEQVEEFEDEFIPLTEYEIHTIQDYLRDIEYNKLSLAESGLDYNNIDNFKIDEEDRDNYDENIVFHYDMILSHNKNLKDFLEFNNIIEDDNGNYVKLTGTKKSKIITIEKTDQDTGKTGNIHITIDRGNRTISIKDDGIGMSLDTVKNAFLNIGGTNKEGLATTERSGGLGLAKVQFLMGSEKIKIITVKDGIKTTINTTNLELYNDDFKIYTEETDEPSGTFVEVTIPQSYTTLEGTTKEISFPGKWDGWKEFHILTKPLIGNVNVTLSYKNNNESNFDDITVPIGINITEDILPPFFTKATFSWGEADVYMSIDKKEYRKQRILSSGIYQFDHTFEKVPYDIVINIKPYVVAASDQYPFNNQREGFKNTVIEDIDSLTKYLQTFAAAENEKEAVDIFSNISPLPNTDPNKILTPKERAKIYADIEEIIQKNKDKSNKKDSYFDIPTEVNINKGTVIDTKTKEVLVNEKKYDSTFKTDKKIESVAPVNTEFFNPAFPQYHNNTNVDYLKIEGASEFFSDFASVVLQMVRTIGNDLGGSYHKLTSKEGKFFAGISIDTQYRGVHVRKIINAIFINPLAFDVDSLEEAVGQALATTIHEINHTTAQNEGETFTSHEVTLYGKIFGTGKFGLYEGLFRSVFNKHYDTFKQLQREYNKSTTRNLSKSFDGNAVKRSSDGIISGNESDAYSRQLTNRGDRSDITGNDKKDIIITPKDIDNDPTMQYVKGDADDYMDLYNTQEIKPTDAPYIRYNYHVLTTPVHVPKKIDIEFRVYDESELLKLESKIMTINKEQGYLVLKLMERSDGKYVIINNQDNDKADSIKKDILKGQYKKDNQGLDIPWYYYANEIIDKPVIFKHKDIYYSLGKDAFIYMIANNIDDNYTQKVKEAFSKSIGLSHTNFETLADIVNNEQNPYLKIINKEPVFIPNYKGLELSKDLPMVFYKKGKSISIHKSGVPILINTKDIEIDNNGIVISDKLPIIELYNKNNTLITKERTHDTNDYYIDTIFKMFNISSYLTLNEAEELKNLIQLKLNRDNQKYDISFVKNGDYIKLVMEMNDDNVINISLNFNPKAVQQLLDLNISIHEFTPKYLKVLHSITTNDLNNDLTCPI